MTSAHKRTLNRQLSAAKTADGSARLEHLNSTEDSKTVTPKAIAKYEEQRQKELALASRVLGKLGYKSEETSAHLWAQLLEHTRQNLFLGTTGDYRTDGKPSEHHLLHELRFPNEALARQFVSTLTAKHPDIAFHLCLQPVECLEDREVTLSSRVLMTVEDVSRVCCQILQVAHVYLGEDYRWRAVRQGDARWPQPPISLQDWPSRPRRKMRLRTEFYGDLLLTRILLAPWVCRWTDVDSRSLETRGADTAVTTLDGHEAEFELANDDVTLDQLRWLLYQATDLHVAAQSLNYADSYTGARLNYKYLDRMTPSDDVLTSLKKSLAKLEHARNDLVERLDGLLQELEVPLESDELGGEEMMPVSDED